MTGQNRQTRHLMPVPGDFVFLGFFALSCQKKDAKTVPPLKNQGLTAISKTVKIAYTEKNV